MPFEYAMRSGVLRVLRTRRRWMVEFNRSLREQWPDADEAGMATARHQSGLAERDQTPCCISDDLLRWRPSGAEI